METETKRGRGRPAGREFTAAKSLRLLAEDDARLAVLAQRWGCSQAAVIRRLLREAVPTVGASR